MAYCFRPDESVNETLVRVSREQIGKAIRELQDDDLDRHEKVHQVRKRCKKLRGLIRIARPALGRSYKAENVCFRDASRRLSYVRDAQSLIETVDDLLAHFAEELDPAFGEGIRTRLVERRAQVAEDEVGLDARLAEFHEVMREAYERAGDWRLSDDGFDALAGGLAKTYRRGRKAMRKALEEPDAARFHEWRKRTKYHWFHLRLLRPVWEPVVKTLCDEADELSDLLGDEHDLAVLRDTLQAEPDSFGDARELELLLALIGRRRLALQQQAGVVGARVFAEPAEALVARFEVYWHAWEAEQGLGPGITPAPALS